VRHLTAGLAVTLLAVASGCGGGDDGQTRPLGSTAQTATTDPAAQAAADQRAATAYRRRANAVCRENYRKSKRFPRPRQIEDLKPLVDKDVALQNHSLARFRALDPPPALQKRHDRIVAVEKLALTRLRTLQRKMTGGSGDLKILKRVARTLNRTRKSAGREFKAAGLAACYQGPSGGGTKKK
jgi:hypothetical protein